MDSGNPPQGKITFVNHAPAQNNVGGSNVTNNQNVTWPPTSVVAASPRADVDVDVKGAGKPPPKSHDGAGPSNPKPELNVILAGDLVLRKQDSSFSNPPKAYALIINIFHYKMYYDNKTKTTVDSTRDGSQRDVENLAGKFKSFNVGVYTPKTQAVEENTVIYVHASDVKRWITDFKENVEEHKKKSGDNKMACFICIMGHGRANGVLTDSLDQEISMEKEIFAQFNNQHFPAMIGNPKIFFTNCCRGNDPSHRVNKPFSFDGVPDESPETVPHVEDFLIGWSTTPVFTMAPLLKEFSLFFVSMYEPLENIENVSLREYDGSIFIQILCQLLQQHLELLSLEMNKYFSGTAVAKNTDLETVLKAVAVEMRSYRCDDEEKSYSQTTSIENRGFAHFRWHIDHFEYSREGWLPSYLKLSQEDRIKLRLKRRS